MITHILDEIIEQFQQESMSIWTFEYGQIDCLLNRNGITAIEEEIERCFREGIEDDFINPGFHFFRIGHIGIVFHGQKSIDTEIVKKYITEHKSWIHVLVEFQKQEEKEKSFQMLIKSAHTIASSMQNEQIFDVIIEWAVKVIPAADTGFLFLFDEKIKKLFVKSAVGFKKESYRKTRLVSGEAITGRVFKTGETVMINGEERIKEAMLSMSEQNFKFYVDSTIDRKFPNCIISCPLIYHDESIGVLTIDSFKENASFSESDREMLKALADHVSVVISHAKVFQSEREHRKELQVIHHALRNEHEQLQRTTDFHNRLTNIVTQGKGSREILQTLYEIVKVPVVVYDSLLKPLTISKGAEKKQLPPNFLKHSAVKKVLRMKKWQKIVISDKEMLIVVPIIGAEYVLGFLCAWIDNKEMIERNSVLFEYGATVLALEWTKQEAVREAQERIKGEFIEEILSGEMNVSLAEQAENLDLPLRNYYAVLLCQRIVKKDNKNPSYYLGMERQILEKQLEHILEESNIHGIVLQRGIYLFVILSFPGDEDKNEARFKIKELLPKLESLPKTYQIGIGRIYKDLILVNKSYKDAEDCLRLLKDSTTKRSLYYAEIGVYRFFLQHDQEQMEFFVSDILGPLIKYEENKQGQLLKTLMMYVRHDKQLNKLTKELSIHYNTLYYRIKRIQDILGISFDEPEEWFNVQLACKVYEYLEKSKA